MNEKIPKYRAIAQHYRALVESGSLAPGTVLPSRRKLAEQWKTSRVTIDKVADLLTAERVLTPSDGNRPQVVADISHRTSTVQNRVESAAATGRALRKRESTRILRVEMVRCPADIAPLLGVTAGTEVLCRERLNLVDEMPVATGHSYYPPEVFAVTPELGRPVSIPSGSRELATERMKSRQSDLTQLVTSRLATDRERELLNLGGAYSVVTQVSRTVLLANGKVVEVAVKVGEGNRPLSFHVAL